MLIQALCDYYDILAEEGKVLPEEYSEVNIHYLVCLNEDGGINEILDVQRREIITRPKGKIQERLIPKTAVMPRRTEKTGIDSNIIEHRPLYLFGLNYAENSLSKGWIRPLLMHIEIFYGAGSRPKKQKTLNC